MSSTYFKVANQMKSNTNGKNSNAGNAFVKSAILGNKPRKLSLQKAKLEEIHFTTEPIKSMYPIDFTDNINKTFNHIESSSFQNNEKENSEDFAMNCLICEEKERNAVFQKCGHGGKITSLIINYTKCKFL